MPRKELFLDTCALLWLVSGGGRISRQTLKRINDAQLVFVSAISAWEISLKQARGQLVLPKAPDEWFAMALESHDLRLHPLDVEVLIAANGLPWHHRDPADRFIIASAIKNNAAVVTADKNFMEYDIEVII